MQNHSALKHLGYFLTAACAASIILICIPVKVSLLFLLQAVGIYLIVISWVSEVRQKGLLHFCPPSIRYYLLHFTPIEALETIVATRRIPFYVSRFVMLLYADFSNEEEISSIFSDWEPGVLSMLGSKGLIGYLPDSFQDILRPSSTVKSTPLHILENPAFNHQLPLNQRMSILRANAPHYSMELCDSSSSEEDDYWQAIGAPQIPSTRDPHVTRVFEKPSNSSSSSRVSPAQLQLISKAIKRISESSNTPSFPSSYSVLYDICKKRLQQKVSQVPYISLLAGIMGLYMVYLAQKRVSTVSLVPIRSPVPTWYVLGQKGRYGVGAILILYMLFRSNRNLIIRHARRFVNSFLTND